jgi:uncharacterized protein (UPF0335 family)
MKRGDRLSRKEWKNIEKLLKNKDKTIQQISDFYGISRMSIYSYGWRHNWIEKKKKTLFQKIKEIFKK